MSVTASPPSNLHIRKEMEETQKELRDALHMLLHDVGKRLKPQERAEAEAEFRELDELLERLKTGLIWIALFGKTSSGKSAVINSLVGSDIAQVGIEHDLTTGIQPYKKEPWMLLDTPGILGNPGLEELAIQEARQAMGHIFLIDGIPYQDEVELFDRVHQALPNTPRIVYVNKADRLQPPMMSNRDQETVKRSIHDKMRKYVVSDEDIVYGSAMRYDPNQDAMVRQPLPQLVDRMYEGAGTLQTITSIIDPAGKAHDALGRVHDKIWEVRLRVARKVIGVFAVGEIGTALVPFGTLIVTPGILATMAYVVLKIMGKTATKDDARGLSGNVLKQCGIVLAGDFAISVAAEIVLAGANIIPIFGQAIFALGAVAGLGWMRYKRTIIFGEVVVEYIKNDFSWGAEGPKAVIARCKERAMKYYTKYQKD